jgi:hypothetical protein
MATSHGKGGLVKVGTATVLETTGWSLTETAETVDDTAHGDDWRTHLVGQKSWTASVTANLDTADSTGQGALTVGASVTLKLYPDGADAGDREYTGTATVTSVSPNNANDALNTISFECQGNGALTTGAVSAG